MPLKRPQIQAATSEAIDTFSRFRLHLPEWAFWTPDQWEQAGLECDEIRHCMLGWDATDFGGGDFDRIGRTLFTLRNGTTRHRGYPKVYSQKYLYDPEGQRAPAHFHQKK